MNTNELTPEHNARQQSDELHHEILETLASCWAMREAFLAGCSFAARNGRCSIKPLSTAAIDQLIDAVEHPSKDQG